MANYGELIENIYDSKSENVYKAFDDYFNNPIMVKIKNVNGLSMYMAKTYCLLSNECRYIIAFTTEDFNTVKSKKPLREISWVSLQTRTLTDKHDLLPHNYQPRAIGPLNKKITRIDKNKTASTYSCDGLPIIITLLHTKSDTDSEYQQYGTVISALETYHTIITFES